MFARKIEKRTSALLQGIGPCDFDLGALCRGLLSGKLQKNTHFKGDDLRLTDPKFQTPRYVQYLTAVRRLDQLSHQRYGKRVIHLAVRWLLDQGATVALWEARHPGQLQPIDEVFGWSLDAAAKSEIDRILRESITGGPRVHGAAAPTPVRGLPSGGVMYWVSVYVR